MEFNAKEQALAEAVRQARATRRMIVGCETAWGVDLAGAYRVQTALSADQPCKGYKLGLISPAKQAQMGITTPLYGRITQPMLLGNPVDLSRFIQPRVEPELVLVLNHPLASGATLGAAAMAIGGVFIGVDVLDSVWRDYRFTATEVVADNTSGGGVLLGARLMHAIPEGSLRLYLNGELRSEGLIRELGNIYERLCWLADTVGGLAEGQVICLGSPAQAVAATGGTLEVAGPASNILVVRLEGSSATTAL